MPKGKRQSEAELRLQLQRIGTEMANLCFILSRKAGEEVAITEREADIMRDLYREWDKAILAIPVKKEKAKANHA